MYLNFFRLLSMLLHEWRLSNILFFQFHYYLGKKETDVTNYWNKNKYYCWGNFHTAKFPRGEITGGKTIGFEITGCEIFRGEITGAKLPAAKLPAAKLSAAKLPAAKFFAAKLLAAKFSAVKLPEPEAKIANYFGLTCRHLMLFLMFKALLHIIT